MEFSHGVCEEQRRRRVTTIHDDDDEQTQQQQQQQHPPISSSPIEKEHMFDKVVTPSDVGKLNRLVIPKQHAEKYFPLDTTSSSSPAATATKGLLLNFEDPSGKPWRFRYSYWNSSQSYVMTKGWSRFVKDKRLDAGDTVSFGRHKDRLFIDWKRRGPHNPHRIPIPLSSAAAAINYPIVSFAPYSQNYGYNAGGGREQFLVFRSTVAPPQAVVGLPMVLDSVPVVAQREEVSAKKFRLFGVNLDVPDQSSGASASSPRGKEKEEPSLDLYM